MPSGGLAPGAQDSALGADTHEQGRKAESKVRVMNHGTTPPTLALPNILLVDDDPMAIQLMGRILEGQGQLQFATSGDQALRLAQECAPDVILLDAEMPGLSGFDVCRALKADVALSDVPVIFITSHSEPAMELSGLELGAADFIAKPVSAPLVLARVRTQLRSKTMADELRRIGAFDALTGVANRRIFNESIEREWLRARRSGEPISLLMVDVDHFKLFNDRYGHPAGDACLQAIAQVMKRSVARPADLVARYGGEEFAVLLPQTPSSGAQHVARALLNAVESLAIGHEASPTASHVTVSVGLAVYDEDSTAWADGGSDSRFDAGMPVACGALDLVAAADRALYAAKRHGRAQAMVLDIADAQTSEARALERGPDSASL